MARVVMGRVVIGRTLLRKTPTQRLEEDVECKNENFQEHKRNDNVALGLEKKQG